MSLPVWITLATLLVGTLVVVALRRIAATDAADRRRRHLPIAGRRGTRVYSSPQWTELRLAAEKEAAEDTRQQAVAPQHRNTVSEVTS